MFGSAAHARPVLPTLGQLVAANPGGRLVRGDPATPVAGICYNSRRLEPHDLFVAVPGRTHDGHQFVAEAVARGASAVVAERMPAGAALGLHESVPLVLVPSARAALADLAGAFYGHPSRRLRLVGVTGTDGKTTTTHLVDAILEARGLRTGRLSTIETKIDGFARSNPTGHTTPEAPLVQRTLAEMVAVGVEAATLETSSHALSLDQVRGCAFDVAVFTNLSPEHLNF
ncbi:MAG: Mur ligase family protein, partial [Chloroflexota bacterium]|nr:Mur ligase family protein [Chloroflexota bacterium]